MVDALSKDLGETKLAPKLRRLTPGLWAASLPPPSLPIPCALGFMVQLLTAPDLAVLPKLARPQDGPS